MSLLPQSKKSAEEIAKLRESLGIPASQDEDLPPPSTATAAPEPVIVEIAAIGKGVEIPAVPPLTPIPIDDAPASKPVRSLKRSERIPVLPVSDDLDLSEAPSQSPLPALHVPKQVRSLRKSEQGPIPVVPAPPEDSTLPVHRHSDRELNEIRRREALAQLGPAPHPLSLTAHPAVVVPGYLFAIAGAAWFHFHDVAATQMHVTAGCVVAALLVAAIIYFKKPLSRHHAAFIAVAALFVIVFGALYYFPQLRHGS